MVTVGDLIEDALFEVHHLANLTGSSHADRARDYLLRAQSATEEDKKREYLVEACQRLEVAMDHNPGFSESFKMARDKALEAEDSI